MRKKTIIDFGEIMKIIHTADVHLCLNMTNSKLPSEIAKLHRKQIFDTFNNIIKDAKEKKADMLLISGDLFEMKYAKASDVKRVFDLFETIPDTYVFISCGNHDFLFDKSFYNTIKLPENVTVFPDELSIIEIEKLNTAVYGFSWNRNMYESIPFSIPPLDKTKKNILVLHADVLNDSDYMPINLKMLENTGFDYIALGHIHKKNMISDKIAYPGSPEPLDFGESDEHGYIFIEETNGEFRSEFVKCAKHKFVSTSFDISGLTDYNTACKNIKKAISSSKNDIVRCTLHGIIDNDIDIDNIYEDIQNEYLYLSLTDKTTKDYDLVKIYRENQDNIIGRFVTELMSEAQHDEISKLALYAGLEALLGNGGAENDNQKNKN